jgi:predicted acylesterase/phospholipase RssA/CRP-like cAMP-binding protein
LHAVEAGVGRTNETAAFDLIDDETVDRLLRDSPVFGRLDLETRIALRAAFEPRIARRGETVIRQGDAADGLYLVGSGRLQVVLENEDGAQVVVNDVGRGELTGEMALLTDQPRSATITALRDSHLLFLSTDAFTRIVQTHPQALRVISTGLIDKLMATIRRGSTTSPATNIVIVPLDRSEPVLQLGRRLSESLKPQMGSVPVMRAEDLQAAVGTRSSELARAEWRENIEASHRVVLYVAEPDFDPWTDECVRQADLVILAAQARNDPALRPVEHEIRRRQDVAAPRTELVLLHEPATAMPSGTRRWLRERHVDRHHHIRIDRAGDYDRVARLLLGTGLGIVFSGGGARGIAHIGVIRALADRGISVDATAGASIGAIVAGAVARGDSPDEVSAQIRAAVVEKSPVDFTFPSVALAAGGRVTRHIRDGAQGADLEDTWLNFLCVSTNLTRGVLEIHDHGPGWIAVRSSFSVPGLFPPMHNEAGDVLVDGGILDNMPVKPLRAVHTGIGIIAVDVGARREFVSAPVAETGVASGWRLLMDSVRRRKVDDLTSLPRILMRLTELGSLGDDDHGECYIRPRLEGVSLLDFDKFDELVEIGERDAGPALDAWLESRSVIDLRE